MATGDLVTGDPGVRRSWRAAALQRCQRPENGSAMLQVQVHTGEMEALCSVTVCTKGPGILLSIESRQEWIVVDRQGSAGRDLRVQWTRRSRFAGNGAC